MSEGKRIIKVAGAMVFWFFFLPWLTISCGSQRVATLSGFDLAAGTQAKAIGNSYGPVTHPVLFLVPFFALLAVAIAFARPTKSAIYEFVLSIGSFVVMLSKWLELSGRVDANAAVRYQAETGLWLTFGALGLMGVGSVMGLEKSSDPVDEAITEGSSLSDHRLSSGNVIEVEPSPTRVPCQFCAEMIRPDSEVCRFCGKAMPVQAANRVANPLGAYLAGLPEPNDAQIERLLREFQQPLAHRRESALNEVKQRKITDTRLIGAIKILAVADQVESIRHIANDVLGTLSGV